MATNSTRERRGLRHAARPSAATRQRFGSAGTLATDDIVTLPSSVAWQGALELRHESDGGLAAWPCEWLHAPAHAGVHDGPAATAADAALGGEEPCDSCVFCAHSRTRSSRRCVAAGSVTGKRLTCTSSLHGLQRRAPHLCTIFSAGARYAAPILVV